MVRRTLLIMIVFLAALTAAAQENMRIRGNWSDTISVSSYIRATDSMQYIDPDHAALRYQQALLMSQSIKFDKATLHCLTKLGEYYLKKRYHTRSLAFLYEALPYCETAPEKFRWIVPEVHNLIGNNHQHLSQNDSALVYYTQAYHLIDSLQIDKPRLATQIVSNLGAALATARQYPLAAQYILQSINALTAGQELPTFNRRDSILLALNYGNYGSWHANYKEAMDSAHYWWSRAIPLYKGLGMKAELQGTYANIVPGLLSDGMLQPDTLLAKRYLDSAIAVDSGLAQSNIQLQIGLARLHFFQRNYPLAIDHANHALEWCERTGNRERKLLIYTTLSRSYAFQNKPKQSQHYQYLFSKLADSLLNNRINSSVSSLEVQYRLTEKDKVLAENKARIYQQRSWLAASIGGGVILLLSVVGLVRASRQKRRLHDEQLQNLQQQKKIEKLQVKMEAEEQERSRIAKELHDGLGVLLSAAKINHTVLAKDLATAAGENVAYAESSQILQQMQQEIKTITHNLVPHYISHKSLEDALEALAAKFNRPGSFQIRIQSYGAVQDLHPDRSFGLYRVIEEIIHNAVKHSGGTEVLIQLLYHSDKLHITIEDNGRGFNTERTGTGMGLQNIKSRIEALKGFYNLSSEQGSGTTYSLEIPY